VPQSYTVPALPGITGPGVTHNCSNCSILNSPISMPFAQVFNSGPDATCQWVSAAKINVDAGGESFAAWTLNLSGNTGHAQLAFGEGFVGPVYQAPLSSWNPLGSNALSLISGSTTDGCQTFPSSILIAPA
jgi:hypothetical protein